MPKHPEIPGGSPGGWHLPVLRGRPPGSAQRPRAAPQRGRDGDPQRDKGAKKNGLNGVVVLIVWC